MLNLRICRPTKVHLTGFLILFLFIIATIVGFYDSNILKSVFNIFTSSRVKTDTRTKNSSKTYFDVRLNLKIDQPQCKYHDNLIIYILSTATNFERRQVIRTTWGSPLDGTCFLFIVGSLRNSTLQQLRLFNEQTKYRDLIQINHLESYANVIYKEVAALKWSHQFCPFIPYLFKTDDDLIIDSILLSSMAQILVTNLFTNASYIKKHQPELARDLLKSDRRTFFRGAWAMEFQPTLRDGKFGIPNTIWAKEFLPPYCSGFGWMMSKMVRNRLLSASKEYPLDQLVFVGDVFLSGFLALKAGVQCTSLSIKYEQTALGNCSCLMQQQPLLAVCSSSFHNTVADDDTKLYREYAKAWNIIKQRHMLVDSNLTASVTVENCLLN